jgi:hypothetical protein
MPWIVTIRLVAAERPRQALRGESPTIVPFWSTIEFGSSTASTFRIPTARVLSPPSGLLQHGIIDGLNPLSRLFRQSGKT